MSPNKSKIYDPIIGNMSSYILKGLESKQRNASGIAKSREAEYDCYIVSSRGQDSPYSRSSRPAEATQKALGTNAL